MENVIGSSQLAEPCSSRWWMKLRGFRALKHQWIQGIRFDKLLNHPTCHFCQILTHRIHVADIISIPTFTMQTNQMYRQTCHTWMVWHKESEPNIFHTKGHLLYRSSLCIGCLTRVILLPTGWSRWSSWKITSPSVIPTFNLGVIIWDTQPKLNAFLFSGCKHLCKNHHTFINASSLNSLTDLANGTL